MLQTEEERKKQWLIMMVEPQHSVYSLCGLVTKGVSPKCVFNYALNRIWTGCSILNASSALLCKSGLADGHRQADKVFVNT